MKSGWFIGAVLCPTILVMTAWAETGGGNDAPAATSDPQAVEAQGSANDSQSSTMISEKSAPLAELRVGDRIDPSAVHTVTRPGLYGMGKVPPGSAYGVLEGNLVRYNIKTMRLQSVIRSVDTILD